MNFHKTHLDPMRWKVVALVALALFGIGAMHTHVLMIRRGEEILSALVSAGGMILLAAIPIGYLVYRNWFTEHAIGLTSAADEDGNEEHGSSYECGHSGWGHYSNGARID